MSHKSLNLLHALALGHTIEGMLVYWRKILISIVSNRDEFSISMPQKLGLSRNNIKYVLFCLQEAYGRRKNVIFKNSDWG